MKKIHSGLLSVLLLLVELYIPPGMDSVIDNPLSNNLVFNIFPPKDQPGGLAKARVSDGSKVTELSAKKIIFKLSSEAFLLETSATIIQGEDVLKGPVKIEYNPEELVMTTTGTIEQPATFSFNKEGGEQGFVRCKEMQFIFEMQNGNRVLKSMKINNNL